jgi:hypothetical protein
MDQRGVFCGNDFAFDCGRLYLEGAHRQASAIIRYSAPFSMCYVPVRHGVICQNVTAIGIASTCFKRGSERGLWWSILTTLQQKRK